MENKIVNGVNAIRNIISIGAMLLVLGVLGYIGYNYFFGKTVLVSEKDLFQITAPGKFDFVENTSANSEYYMAKVDESKKLYIFILAYEKAEDKDFKTIAEEERAYYLENPESTKNLSDLKDVKIGDYDAYMLSYEYVDENEEDYYLQLYMIEGKEAMYYAMFESPVKDQDKYKADFEKIAKTFKEIEA